jgi:hypothetical protein
MFGVLCALQCEDDLQLAKTLHSFHLIQAAVRCDETGHTLNRSVLACF